MHKYRFKRAKFFRAIKSNLNKAYLPVGVVVTNLAINLVALSSDPGRRTNEIDFSGVRVSTIHRIGTGLVPFLPWALSVHLYEI